MPLSPGIPMSMRTTSGSRETASSTACRPSFASPTMTMDVSASRRARMPWRTIAWSSTRSREVRIPGEAGLRGRGARGGLRTGAPRDRDLGLHEGPALPGGADGERPADHVHSLPHAEEPQVPVGPGGHGRLDVERGAVVPDVQAHPAGGPPERDADVRGPGVAPDVHEGLLRDAVQGRAPLAVERLGVRGRREGDPDPVLAAELPGEGLERRDEPHVVEE